MSYGNETIYLDHAATTPTSPTVVEAMLPYFTATYGNPSSIYRLGQDARAGLDRARGEVARALRCRPDEIVFTSGATESVNAALRGIAWAARLSRPDAPAPHIVTTAIEHHAVLHTVDALERQGFRVSRVAPRADGIVEPPAIRDAIETDTCLIAVMYANNEIGSIQPLAAIGEIAREHGIPLFTDAVQAGGVLPLDVNALGADALALSAHKFYGPKGVGVLYVRKGTAIEWQQEGGGQESGRRGGTENTPLIVGLGRALAEAESLRDDANAHCAQLRDALWAGIHARIPGVHLNGPEPGTNRLPNNLNIAIDGVQGETILLALDMQGVAASAGSACTTGNSEPSHVILACGHPVERARTSLRLTVGRGNSLDEIERAVDVLVDAVERVRRLSMVS